MTNKIHIGTIGLGLMGSSIAACLLAAGHPVTSLVKDIEKAEEARSRILGYLHQLQEEGISKGPAGEIIKELIITDDFSLFSGLEVVIESIIENQEEKKEVFRKLEEVLPPTSIIGTNTSAIPVTLLQSGLKHPERVYGIHWAEPAHII